MFDSVVRALQQMIETSLADVNTQIPGTIVSFDAARNRAVVRPDLPKRIASDEPLAPPNIVEVPVQWASSGGGKASLTMPLKPGDGVMLAFQQRSLEGWLSGIKDMPDDPRQFDLSDCIAIPGVAPGGITVHPENVVLKFDKSSLTFTKDNQIILDNGKCSILLNDNGNVFINSSGVVNIGNAFSSMVMDAAGNMTMNINSLRINAPGHSFTIEDHRHTGVQPGSGNSSIPVNT